MAIDAVLHESISQIPDCIAGAYIDAGTGLLLCAATLTDEPQELIGVLPAITADLFLGTTGANLAWLWNKTRNSEERDAHSFNEVVVLNDNHIVVFLRCMHNPDHAIAYVIKKTANIGLVLAKSRMTVKPLEAAL